MPHTTPQRKGKKKTLHVHMRAHNVDVKCSVVSDEPSTEERRSVESSVLLLGGNPYKNGWRFLKIETAFSKHGPQEI